MKRLFIDNKPINRLLITFYCTYIALLVIITLDTLILVDHSNKFWPAWLLQIVPLLMLLPGIMLKRYRSFSWVCFLMLLYFSSFVVQVYTDYQQWIDWLGLMVTVTIFITAMITSRSLQRYFLRDS